MFNLPKDFYGGYPHKVYTLRRPEVLSTKGSIIVCLRFSMARGIVDRVAYSTR